MIEVRDITIAYGREAVLENFSAHIEKNSITAIIGPNGCGKSSLLSAISGDIELQSGEITINGLPVDELTFEELAYLRSLAQQSHSYWMAYPVKEIIWMGHQSVPQNRFEYLVEALDMRDILEKKITTLSGGQLQRVEIARAFMRDSTLVLLDEPFASQDVQSIDRLTHLMKSEKERGVTIVIVAHAHRTELAWCDEIISLER